MTLGREDVVVKRHPDGRPLTYALVRFEGAFSERGAKVTPNDVKGPAAKSLALQLRMKRSELMVQELEAVALRLFDLRGFKDVTVDEIVSEAHISARTFYRYFPNKEDVLQVHIDRRSRNLRAALSARPVSEEPLESLRLALAEQLATEDPELVRAGLPSSSPARRC